MLSAFELATDVLTASSSFIPGPSLGESSGLVPVLPHLRYPFVMTTTGAEVLEQDSLPEVAGCVNLIVDVPQDAIPELPGLGIPDPTFGQIFLNTGALVDLIGQQEPRAQLTITQNADQTVGRALVDGAFVFSSTSNADDLLITVSAESDSQ